MRNLLIIGGICVLAIAFGAWLYVTHPNAPIATTIVANTETPTGKDVSFTVVDQGDQAAGMPARKNYAIYDAGTFADFWKKEHATDGKKAPFVDFSKNYVIAVYAGTEPTGGYKIAVTKITDTANQRSVEVAITAPGGNCSVIEEQTSPYQFVVVPDSGIEALSHTDTQTTGNCN